eukprot:8645632-Pyramimonas_sp.AAC.1
MPLWTDRFHKCECTCDAITTLLVCHYAYITQSAKCANTQPLFPVVGAIRTADETRFGPVLCIHTSATKAKFTPGGTALVALHIRTVGCR